MSKSIGSAGLELIKKFEGCRLTAYQDSVGVWTIGYGHTSGVKSGMKITQAQADAYLKSDCQKFADYVDNASYVPITSSLNSNQRDALISFAFNCGQGNLKKLCAGRSADQISAKITAYNKAGGKVLNGLTRRRAAEQALFNKAVSDSPSNNEDSSSSTSYKVKITASLLNVRAGAGTSYKVNTTVKKDQVYTIIAESNGWGKLKSGAGWISLKYTVKC